MKKKLFCVLLALCLSVSVFAKEKLVNYVIKFEVECPYDVEFMKKTFQIKESKELGKLSDGEFYTASAYFDVDSEALAFTKHTLIVCDQPVVKLSFGPFFAIKNNFDPKDDILYMGSWVLKINPYTFELEDAYCKDEYDECVKWYTEKKGEKKASKLIRAEFVNKF